MTLVYETETWSHSGTSKSTQFSSSGSATNLGTQTLTESFEVGSIMDRHANPLYVSRMADGEVVLGPYSRSGSRVLANVPSSGTHYQSWPNGNAREVIFDDVQLVHRALVESKLGAGVTNYDVEPHKVVAATGAQAKMLEGAAQTAVSIAEFGKTMNLLQKTANRIVRTLRSARRSIRHGTAIKDIKSLRRNMSLDMALNEWLEYRYGWRPLLYDMASHQEALTEILDRSDRIRKVADLSDFTVSTELSGDQIGGVHISNVGSCYAYGNAVAVPKRVGAFAGYFFRIDPQLVNSSMYWLGFQNPLSVAWELVPYSFVVDWFANTSDYLTSVGSFPAFVRDPQGYLSTSRSWVVTAETTHKTWSGGYSPTDTCNQSLLSWEIIDFTRELIKPGDYVGLKVDVNLSVSKGIDLFALAKNLAGSNKQDVLRRIRR